MESQLSIKDWIFVTRPWSFAVSALPAFVAMMYVIHTHSHYNWHLGIVAVVGAVIFHAGGNLLSDYNDYNRGVDQIDKQGGTDTLTSGLFNPRQILIYGASLIAIGIAIGLYLVSQVGFGLLWIGVIGTIGAVFYSFFKFRALGDLLIFVIYGPSIMLGTGYVMLSEFDWTLIFVSFPLAFITVNVLHSNNTRDQRSDRHADIQTLAMKIGTKASVVYYYLLTIFSYVSIVVMVVTNTLPITALITLLTIPIAYKNCMAMKKVNDEDTTAIDGLDEATAKLQLVFSTLLSLALIVATVL